MKHLRRKSAAGLAALALATVTAAPAFAESFTSSLLRVYSGFNSRNWGDDNNGSTHVTFRGCYLHGGVFTYTTVALWRQRGLLPDEHLAADQKFYCSTYHIGWWNSPNPDVYRFNIVNINGATSNSFLMSTRPDDGVLVEW